MTTRSISQSTFDYSAQCPVCSGENLQFPYHFVGFDVVGCKDCRTAWRSNMYSREKLDDIYCGGEYEHHPYFDRDTEEEDSLTLQRYKNYATGLDKIRSVAGLGRLLDVGAGSGTVLKIAQKDGWNVEGVEMSPALADAVAKSLNAKVYKSSFEDLELEPESFDALTFWDIIEHVTDPVRVIEQAHSMLRPGGGVLFCTPDESSWLARLGKMLYRVGYKYPALALHPTNHTYFFSRDNFRSILNRAGFVVTHEYSQSAYFEHSPLASDLQKLGITVIESVSALVGRQYEMVFIARRP